MQRMKWTAFVGGIVLAATTGASGAPAIRNLNVRGLTIGGETTLVVDGAELLPEPRLVTDLPLAAQAVAENPTDARVTFRVTLAPQATPGVYHLRVASGSGVSEPILVAVDRLPQRPFAPQVESLPAALHGTVAGSAVLATKWPGKAGQEIVVEVEAQRLGAKLRPVVHLYDARRRQLAWALPAAALFGDCRLTTKLPADGEYTVELHDLQYAAPAPSHFRLKLGTLQFADQVFPPAVEKGKPVQLELLGNGPPTPLTFTGTEFGTFETPWPGDPTGGSWRPAIQVTALPEMLEGNAPAPQPLPGAPVAVSGRLDRRGQIDVYRLPVAEGAKLRFELFANRLGAPIDGALEVRNPAGGAVLVRGDDGDGTTDPRVDYTVAKGLTEVDVAVIDQLDRGDRLCLYRLLVTNLDRPSATDAGFRLKVSQATVNVPQGATRVVQVAAERSGYDGPIRLAFDRLPPGVTAATPEIPARATGTLVTLASTGTASPVLTQLRGTGDSPDRATVALSASAPLGETRPWLSRELAFAATPAAVQWPVDWGLPTDAKLTAGLKLSVPIAFQRPPGEVGPVRVSLVSGQPVPLNQNRQPDVNQALRGEKEPVDLALDPKAKAAADAFAAADKAAKDAKTKAGATPDDAQKKAVQDAEAKLVAAEKALRDVEAALPKTVDYVLLVPATLPEVPYDLSFRVELRSLDNARVVSESYVPVRRLALQQAIGLRLAANKFSGTLEKTGTAVKVTGTIERRGGFDGVVTVTLAGQPAGVTADKVELKADQTEFALDVKFPANAQAGDVAGLKLAAAGPPDAKQPNVLVRAEVPVTITLAAAP